MLSARWIIISCFFSLTPPGSQTPVARNHNFLVYQVVLPHKKCVDLEKVLEFQVRLCLFACARACWSVSRLSVSVVLCVSRVVGGAGTVQVADLHGKEGGVLCLRTQTSVGQTGFDRRHHRQKNNKIRNRPSQSLPTLPSPFISQLSMNSSVSFTLFFLFTSPPLFHSHCSFFLLLSAVVRLFNTTSPFPPHRPFIYLTHYLLRSHRSFLIQFTFTQCPLCT